MSGRFVKGGKPGPGRPSNITRMQKLADQLQRIQERHTEAVDKLIEELRRYPVSDEEMQIVLKHLRKQDP